MDKYHIKKGIGYIGYILMIVVCFRACSSANYVSDTVGTDTTKIIID